MTDLERVEITPSLQNHSAAYGDHLIYILGRLSCLHADIREQSFTDPIEAHRQAWLIETELSNWKKALPPCFQYSQYSSPTNSPLGLFYVD